MDLTRQCLIGLLQHERCPVYVVDNGSTDGSPEAVRSEFPAVNLIECPVNSGFATGNNLGIAHAIRDGADAVFLLNNDTIIDEPFVEPCLAELERDDGVGVVGPVVVEGRNPSVVQSAGGTWNLWTVYMPFRNRNKIFARSSQIDSVDWVLGAAMLIRVSMLPRVGGPLDPEYFPAYVEEADLCYRAKLGGYSCRIVHSVRVRHLGGQSAGSMRIAFQRMMANRFRFALKHSSAPKFFVAAAVITARVILEKVAPRWK
jgi:GT2 family glycosyltransferase